MQSQFTEVREHLAEWGAIAQRIDAFLQTLERHTAAVDRLTTRLADRELPPDAPQEARQVPVEQAVQEIHQLFQQRGRLFYSDIVEALRLDLATVITACEQLQQRGLIEGDLQ